MLQLLIKNWWLLALRGVLAALFAAMAFLMRSSAESLTLREFATQGMIVFLGILALAAGVCTATAGIWSSGKHKSWLLVLDGLAIAASGMLLILSNGISFRMITNLLVLLALAVGMVELAMARVLRRHLADEWLLGIAGATAIAFALAFLKANPEEPGRSLVWLGAYFSFNAICMLGLALRLRSLRASVHRIAKGVSQSV